MSGSTIRTDTPGNGCPTVRAVGGNDRRAFGDAVSFDRCHTKFVLKGLREPQRQFLRPGQDHAQVAELLRGAAAIVQLQKGRGRDHKRNAVAGTEISNGSCLEWCGLEDNPRAITSVEPQQHVPEGVEKRQDAKGTIRLVEMDDLSSAFNV